MAVVSDFKTVWANLPLLHFNLLSYLIQLVLYHIDKYLQHTATENTKRHTTCQVIISWFYFLLVDGGVSITCSFAIISKHTVYQITTHPHSLPINPLGLCFFKKQITTYINHCHDYLEALSALKTILS